ncbi:MAG: FAD-linked oxidase C-terminal domain-containing protein [Myxococcota bacterium]
MGSTDAALIAIDRALGTDALITDRDQLQSYAKDESEATPVEPVAVVRVASTADVAAVVQAANDYGIPITPRGGGTSRVGGSVPEQGGLVLSFERMQEIREVDRHDMTALVEPGVPTGLVHRAVEAEGLFYPPDPNSADTCAIGGNIGANAAGPRALKYGVTREYVLGMTVVTGDGTVLQLGKRTRKGVTGYDLTALMVGSEGTLGIVTEARLKLIPKPEAIATMMVFVKGDVGVESVVNTAIRERLMPRCVELLDTVALELVRPQAGLDIPKDATAMLLLELDGSQTLLEGEVERLGNALLDCGALDVLVAATSNERERLWSARRQLSYSMRRKATFKLSEDVVVPRPRIGDLLRYCRETAEREEILIPTYGHAGDGNLHVNFLWNSPDERPRVDRAIEGLFRRTLELGGTLSGEHGLGLLKAPYLHLEQSPALISYQKQIKQVFDPKGILNPSKVFSNPDRKFHGMC